MSFIEQPYIIFFAITLLHIFAAVNTALFRWFHVCKPYRHNPNYYFPARKAISITSLGVLLSFPYLLNPGSDIGFLCACMVVMWDYPQAGATICYTYFSNNTLKSERMLKYFYITLLVQITLCGMAVIAPSYCMANLHNIKAIIVILSVLMQANLVYIMYRLYQLMKQSYYDTYSNVDDFPIKLAFRALATMLGILILVFLPIITNNRIVLAIVQVCMIIWHTLFTVDIMDTKITGKNDTLMDNATMIPRFLINAQTAKKIIATKVDDNQSSLKEDIVIGTDDEPSDYTVSEKKLSRNLAILKKILEYMEKEKPFLSPHFSAVELANQLNTNRTYLASAIRQKYSSFYNMVNDYRIAYAQKYLQENPNTKAEDLAIISGFGSYRSYARAIKSIKTE